MPTIGRFSLVQLIDIQNLRQESVSIQNKYSISDSHTILSL